MCILFTTLINTWRQGLLLGNLGLIVSDQLLSLEIRIQIQL